MVFNCRRHQAACMIACFTLWKWCRENGGRRRKLRSFIGGVESRVALGKVRRVFWPCEERAPEPTRWEGEQTDQ